MSPSPSADHRKRFVEAFAAAVATGVPFVAALQRAAAETLTDVGDARAMVNCVAHLALDFELATNTRVTADPIVIARLCDAYYVAAAALRATSTTEIHLPFLAATSVGPVHLHRVVTSAEMATLAGTAPRSAPPPHADRPTKKGWFG